MRQLLRILPLIFLAACATEKYPYPTQFVSTEQVGLAVLPPPPAPDSVKYKAEIEKIIQRQTKLSDADRAAAMREDVIRPEMIVIPVLGVNYTRDSHPALYSLLLHTASDSWRIADATQDHFQGLRPWLGDSRVKLLVSPITRPSYPSGHTTTNTVWAHVLSELFPAKRQALFTRAYGVAGHRIDAGVHFPHDVEGGKKLATAIYGKMRMNRIYQKELAAAKAELGDLTVRRGSVPECSAPRDAAMSPCH